VCVCLLSIILVICTALTNPFGPISNFLIICSCIALVALVLYNFNKSRESDEHFDQSSSVSYIIGTESIISFINGLTLYYSAFSQESFPKSNRTWFNISPHFISKNACPDISVDHTHLTFSVVPSYSRSAGFLLGTTSIVGPKSHKLGILANDAFTIFFTIKFDTFSEVKPVFPIEIIKLFANTMGNNGLSLQIAPDYTITGENVAINMSLGYGDYVVPVSLININTSYVYLFVITKNGLEVKLSVYPNVADLSTSSQVKMEIATLPLKDSDDVLLSNKEMKLNGNGNLQAHIYNFGIVNKFLTDILLTSVFSHTKKEIQKNNEVLKNLSSRIVVLQNELSKVGTCPFNPDICNTCKGVTNWNDISDIILNGGAECMNKINKFCTNNQGSSLCTCWNSSSALSKTSSCKAYTSIFSGTGDTCIKVESIDNDTLNKIKSIYNLIDQPTQIAKSVLPPKVINNEYTINSSDIEVYNKIVDGQSVNNPVVKNFFAKWF
jgi:hypothetical protein